MNINIKMNTNPIIWLHTIKKIYRPAGSAAYYNEGVKELSAYCLYPL